jgi:hypothetical protein
MELGARVGGGSIPEAIEVLLGFDPVVQQILADLGEQLLPIKTETALCSAHLQFPLPNLNLAQRVKNIRAYKTNFKIVVSEYIPNVGTILPANVGYMEVPGRYVLYGPEEQVLEDIQGLLENFSIDLKPVEENINA